MFCEMRHFHHLRNHIWMLSQVKQNYLPFTAKLWHQQMLILLWYCAGQQLHSIVNPNKLDMIHFFQFLHPILLRYIHLQTHLLVHKSVILYWEHFLTNYIYPNHSLKQLADILNWLNLLFSNLSALNCYNLLGWAMSPFSKTWNSQGSLDYRKWQFIISCDSIYLHDNYTTSIVAKYLLMYIFEGSKSGFKYWIVSSEFK